MSTVQNNFTYPSGRVNSSQNSHEQRSISDDLERGISHIKNVLKSLKLDISLVSDSNENSQFSQSYDKIDNALQKYLRDNVLTQGKEIGHGTFSHVYELIDGNGGEMKVLKVQRIIIDLKLKKSGVNFDRTRGEYLASTIEHPNIIKPEKILYWENERITTKPSPGSPMIAMIMPRIKGKSIRQLLDNNQTFTKIETWKIVHQIAMTLQFLHQSKIAHRDIKGGNIILDENNNATLIDFGIAKKYPCGSVESPIGTMPYISPERLLKSEITDTDFGKIDVWSLGVEMLQLLGYKVSQGGGFAMTPFIHIEIPSTCDSKSSDLLKHMLEQDPKKRWSMEQVVDTLNAYIHDEEPRFKIGENAS